MSKYILDIEKIAQSLEFDIEDVQMLIEVFLETACESMQSLKDAIDTNNFEEIRKSAHSIKGSAANLTFEHISALAKDIELNAKECKDINYNEKYGELHDMIQEIK